MIKAEIVADSLSPQGDRLTSLLITFPRIILAEVNTHRMLSKNTSSSRAIPFNKMVEAVQNDPFIPIAWQREHSGMQGTEYLTEPVDIAFANDMWLEARNRAIRSAKAMNKAGTDNIGFVTKQLCNRLLEPFMWTTMLITGSKEGWDNFFELRCPSYEIAGVKKLPDDTLVQTPTEYVKSRKEAIVKFPQLSNFTDLDWLRINKGQAEIHMMALAEKIYDAMNESTPKQLQAGEYHIPFTDRFDSYSNLNTDTSAIDLRKDFDMNDIKISTAMAARTSYTVVGDEKALDYNKMIELHDKLIAQNPPHCFTEGTEVLTDKGWIDFKDVTKESNIATVNITNLKFNGYEKPINIINSSYEGIVYNLIHGNITITPNHKLLGIKVTKSSDRQKSYDDTTVIIPTNELNNKKDIYRELRMFSAVNPEGDVKDHTLYNQGRFLGFFLGDGYSKYKSSVYFHLRKERKIEYIKEIISLLNLEASFRTEIDGTTTIKILVDSDYRRFYNKDKRKYIPEEDINYNIDFIKGLFDGLKNSDGSIKRNTWIYDTYSKDLKDLILRLCPIIGLTGIEYDTYEHYRIGFTTDNKILFNDSRKNQNRIKEEVYKGNVYCVEIPSNGIIVRKDGKVLITHNSSPMEHCARAMTMEEYESHVRGTVEWTGGQYDKQLATDGTEGWCRNFKGFIQYRHIIETNEV